MSNEPTETVDVMTDDLDAFTDLLNGKAAPAPEVKEEIVDDIDPGDANSAAEDDTSSDDIADPDPDEDDKEQKPEKKVNRFQERINELTAKAKEAERREADIQRKLDELSARQEKPDPKPTAQKEVANLPNPDAKNQDGSDKYPLGEFDPAYIRDLNRVIIEEERTAYKEKEQKEEYERNIRKARDEIQAGWVEKLAPVTEQHEDFLEKTLQLENTFEGLDGPYSDYLVQTIKHLEHGPEVLYYLANNLEEAKRVVQGGPLVATLTLGELNSMFKGQVKKENKVSQAPPPPQNSTKGTSMKKTVAADTDDLDAFSDVFFPRKKK